MSCNVTHCRINVREPILWKILLFSDILADPTYRLQHINLWKVGIVGTARWCVFRWHSGGMLSCHVRWGIYVLYSIRLDTCCVHSFWLYGVWRQFPALLLHQHSTENSTSWRDHSRKYPNFCKKIKKRDKSNQIILTNTFLAQFYKSN